MVPRFPLKFKSIVDELKYYSYVKNIKIIFSYKNIIIYSE